VTASADARGSVWRRWDPHIHTPGTVLNNQFSGDGVWDAYLTAIETSSPTIEAIGVTDYCSIDRYCDVLEHQENGRLPNVGLVFPNIELRFDIGTSRNSPINFHLLVSPDDPGHVEQTRLFLRKLTFMVRGETYSCLREDLVRLGRLLKDDASLDERAAIEEATNQVKVSVPTLRAALDDSKWAQENIIIAVAGGQHRWFRWPAEGQLLLNSAARDRVLRSCDLLASAHSAHVLAGQRRRAGPGSRPLLRGPESLPSRKRRT
jgi:hypothetical protein